MTRRSKLSHDPVIRNLKSPDFFTGASNWSHRLTPNTLGKTFETDRPASRMPLLVLGVVGLFLFVVLFMQLLQLQVAEGERLRGVAEGNRVREQVIYAPRGRILDRNGEVLAANTASFQLSVTPYLLPESSSDRQSSYHKLAALLNDLEAGDIQAAVDDEGALHTQPVLLAEGIAHQTALKIEYILPELDGFVLDSVPIRDYQRDAALGQVLGYVGRVAQEDLDQNPDLHPIDFIGKSGIEYQYDELLRGRNGILETEVDALGRPLRTLRQQPSQPGQDIHLSIDFGLQQKLAEALKKQLKESEVSRGSGVIMDPQTGEILAMVSLPSYDNNLFAKGIDQDQYQELISHPDNPMFNRVVAGGYPTGSTIKPFTLAGALETNTVTEDTIIHDRGSITVTSQYDPSAGFTFRGWNPDGLGPMDARSAMAWSSNIYFYTVAGGYRDFQGMGIENLVRYYRMFGLGDHTGIDLPGETAGRVPTPEWKQEHFDEAWFVGDTYNLSIGQGNILVTPLQLARGYSAVANGGRILTPQLLYSGEPKVSATVELKKRHLTVIQEGMRAVVSGDGSVSPALFRDSGVAVAGKTGTAETDPGKREPHGWFGAYAPYGNPELAAVAMLEEGESGEHAAAPVIAEVFEWYFNR